MTATWKKVGEVFVSDEQILNSDNWFLDIKRNVRHQVKYAIDSIEWTEQYNPAIFKKIVAQTLNSNLPCVPFVELPPVRYTEADILNAIEMARETDNEFGEFEVISNVQFSKTAHEILAFLQPEIVVEPVMDCECPESRILGCMKKDMTICKKVLYTYEKDGKPFIRVKVVTNN